MGVVLLYLLCMCEFYFIFFTPNSCIKVSNYLLLFSLYFYKLLNLVFKYCYCYGGVGIPTLDRLMIIMK